MTTCKSLYVMCVEFCVQRIEIYSRKSVEDAVENGSRWIENLAGPVVEDLLCHAFQLANAHNKSILRIWREEWKIFFTSKISSAVISWDPDLINYISRKCKNLQRCEVVSVKSFNADLILKLPKSVTTLDFDGELTQRGKITKPLLFQKTNSQSWLPHAEGILKAQLIFRTPLPSYVTAPGVASLQELHLGTVKASKSDLKLIIKNCSNLRLLRHYQLVAALHDLYCEPWKKKEILPKLKLKNLDVDFSHVTRCRMSPEWVLSPDALGVAVLVCPNANSIRVRFDCSTPHDVLAPLLNLPKIVEFSAVCVTSGERTLLDFTDMTPIFEKNGPCCLSFLELKVIEEVEIHVIIENCMKLDTLILSGCAYVTPPTCSSFACHRLVRGSFKNLRYLFYADGDDFSWDHGVPECFWKATLCPSGETQPVKLQGLFLEFPRMSSMMIKEVFCRSDKKSSTRLPFPELQALSFCRFDEISADDIATICGFQCGPSNFCHSIKYIRLSECEKITKIEERKLQKWAKHVNSNVKIDVDSDEESFANKKQPHSFKPLRQKS